MQLIRTDDTGMYTIESPDRTTALDIQRIRDAEFPVVKSWTFFNHAACSPLPARAVQAMQAQVQEQSFHGNLGNPLWSKNRERVRALAARLINAYPDEIALVGNTADGLNIAANGFNWSPGDNVVTTNVEYPANMYPWLNLARRGVQVRAVPERLGRICIDDIKAAIDGRTRMLAISWVEFASGFMNDLTALGALCREHGLLFVVDAIQALGAFPLDVKAARIDVLACGGHKWLLGPRGCGIFYCSREALQKIEVSIAGAYSVVDDHNYLDYNLTFKPDSRRFEHGTENAVGIAGLRSSLELIMEVGREAIRDRIIALTDEFCEKCCAEGYTITSSREEGEASGLVFFERKGEDMEKLAAYLQKERLVLSLRDGRLRFAPHFYNTREEVDALVSALRAYVRDGNHRA